ncbi:hypothetical protein GPAL_0454 [Glaciecola pallidula DSM 14239 = ACAM 615]|uniref:Uncharacterized protein n=1 Tax=Brumicola pallidula DSM 14239 = ACAM 615 TaxID=1121922 RepID=K6Y3H6_9ALTE|nr:hypothetical protein GPAL_0454 [Glaciecola pallidula DSM 14239 = ACAM 615]
MEWVSQPYRTWEHEHERHTETDPVASDAWRYEAKRGNWYPH